MNSEKTIEKAIREAYKNCISIGHRIGESYVDFKTLYTEVKSLQPKITLTAFKHMIIKLSRENHNFHISRCPRLMLDIRYTIQGNNGLYYYLQIFEEIQQ